MRFFKAVLTGLLVLALIGVGVFWAFMNNGNGFNLSMLFGQQNQNQMDGHSAHSTHGSEAQGLSSFNNLASQNKDKLVKVSTALNQIMDQITNDPYSQITVSKRTDSSDSGNITVMPREGVTINIAGGKEQEVSPGTVAVYDQGKLEQLHTGIYKFSQASALLNELNNDLTDQSILMESNPPDLQTYVMRSNLLMQNRSKLYQATKLINESMALVNINPYAPQSGYVYNPQKMKELHQSIAELGRISLTLNGLTEELNQQIKQADYDTRQFRMQVINGMQGMNGMPGMDQGAGHSAHGAQAGSDAVSGNYVRIGLSIVVIITCIVLLVLFIKKILSVLFSKATEG